MDNMIPKKGVLFLGGHHNMIKKLQKRHPDWCFITDDNFKHRGNMNYKIVFFWTSHCSHKMMRFVYSKLNQNVVIHYVKSTNLDMLEWEMLCALKTA